MYKKFVIISLILAGTLAACNLTAANTAPTSIPSPIPTLEFAQSNPIPAELSPSPSTLSSPPVTAPVLSAHLEVINRAALVVAALKEKDVAALSGYIHPQMGLRFSPYAFVRDADLVLTANQVSKLPSDSSTYTWGSYSGSGAPIDLSFSDYYSQFLYDVDFADAPQLSLNHRLGEGNSMDNSLEFYPRAVIVEFHFPGFDPQYEGMDWRSLRLVFLEYNGTWYLAGIIHDQWTP